MKQNDWQKKSEKLWKNKQIRKEQTKKLTNRFGPNGLECVKMDLEGGRL
jgi:hypothetical protein